MVLVQIFYVRNCNLIPLVEFTRLFWVRLRSSKPVRFLTRSNALLLFYADDNDKINYYFSIVRSPADRHLIHHLHLIAVGHQVVLHQVLGSYCFIHKHVFDTIKLKQCSSIKVMVTFAFQISITSSQEASYEPDGRFNSSTSGF